MKTLKKILPWHETLIVLKCDTSLTVTDIAERLNKSRRSIYRAMDDDRIKAKISNRLSENATKYSQIRQRIIQNAYKYFDDMLKPGDEKEEGKKDIYKTRLAEAALKGLGEFKEKSHIEVDSKLDEFIKAFRDDTN